MLAPMTLNLDLVDALGLLLLASDEEGGTRTGYRRLILATFQGLDYLCPMHLSAALMRTVEDFAEEAKEPVTSSPDPGVSTMELPPLTGMDELWTLLPPMLLTMSPPLPQMIPLRHHFFPLPVQMADRLGR